MKLLRGLYNNPLPEEGCVATIGNFDGVHLGHQEIVRRVVERASDLNLPSVVVVFEPQPQEYFKGEQAPARLMRFRDKYECLQNYGLDYICVLQFNEKFRALTAKAFIDQVLVNHLKVKHLVVGDDFRFGGDRQGDFQALLNAGEEFGFTVENSDTYKVEGTETQARVSSTLVRVKLADGEFDTVERLLGRPYTLSGRVMYGQQLGRTIGFPTANIALRRKSNPLKGVFALQVDVMSGDHAGSYYGVANLGKKPSVGEFDANLEIHIFDFSGDIYGQRVQVEFLKKIRNEQKFESLQALQEQIERDNVAAREFVAQLNENEAKRL
ncbi:MAG: bifunctional riboflavin kinase/FAD synthetase [Oleiphilaceae bacterium]|nr:bifunctional riboflavin kinase/FAD synthetase [Oleiphilaceae bacterium]